MMLADVRCSTLDEKVNLLTGTRVLNVQFTKVTADTIPLSEELFQGCSTVAYELGQSMAKLVSRGNW